MAESMLSIVRNFSRDQLELYRLAEGERKDLREQLGINVEGAPCADGRHLLYDAFGFPPGIINEYPAIGAILDPGWEAVRNNMFRTWKWCTEQKPVRRNVFMATYHFSGGGHGNCAGHGDNIQASIESASQLKIKYNQSFDRKYSLACVWGFDTDTDLATIHRPSDSKTTIKVADYLEAEPGKLQRDIADLLHGESKQIVQGIGILAQYNLEHGRSVLENPRSFDQVRHNENGIVVGIGAGVSIAPRDIFLRVGCYNRRMEEPLAKAAGIIWHNREMGWTPKGQRSLLLATSTYFDESSPEPLLAKQSARTLASEAKQIVLAAEPRLESVLDIATGIVYHHDRSLEIIDAKRA